MLQDRLYMRRASYGFRRSATVTLLIINVIAFLIQQAVESYSKFPINEYFALSVEGLRHGYAWQVLSFQLMHANLMHLLFNCLAIYMFGRPTEEAVGRKSFWTLYITSGVVGGLCQALAGVLLGGRFAGSVVGASAGAFGLVAAFAVLYPEQVLVLFFVIPLRAKYLLLFSALLAVFGIVFPANDTGGPRIADAAHLGGMLTGVFFVRYALLWTWRWPQFTRARSQPPRRLVEVRSPPTASWARTKHPVEDELPPEEFLSKEVDPILDKISAHGIQSLTERERRILEAAREKMAKR